MGDLSGITAGLEMAHGSNLQPTDGTNIPVDVAAPAGGAIAPGIARVFARGTAPDLDKYADNFIKRMKTISQTVEPLVEAALIELLGATSSYSREESNISILSDGTFKVMFLYKAPLWINTEVKPEFIAKDANYVFNKVKVVPEVKSWSHCSIDVSEGTLRIEFTL